GNRYWAGRYRHHDKKVAGAQEAHECIRPTAMSRRRRDVEAEIRADGGRDAEAMVRVYDLIWKRTVASLMAPAVYDQVSVDIAAMPVSANPVRHLFRATGSTLRFDGFIRIYLEGTDTGEVTTDFLARYFGDHFMDYKFTSDMESDLDDVAEGRRAYQPMVEAFYLPLQDRLARGTEVPKEEVTTEATDQVCPECGSP